MNLDIIALASILTVSFALFVWDRWPPAAVAVATLLALTATGLVSPKEALVGFSSQAVITIAGLLVMGEALVRTGVVRWMAGHMERLAGSSQRRLLLIGTAAPGLLSGFINIVAAVSVFIPALLRIALHQKARPSRLMLPVATVAMAGANLTLIGASHNLVVNDLISQQGNDGLGFFELTPVGVVIVALTLAYALFIGRRLLPESGERTSDQDKDEQLFERYALAGRVWEVAFEPADENGQSARLGDLSPGREQGVQVVLIRRDDAVAEPTTGLDLVEGDLLVVVGHETSVQRWVDDDPRVHLHGKPEVQGNFGASSAELVEVMIPPHSHHIGKTAREMALRDDHGLVAIGLWRDNAPHHDYVREKALRAGDALLLYGDKRATRGFDADDAELLWLRKPSHTEAPRSLRHLGKWTALIFIAVVFAAALDIVPIAFGALAGAVAVGLLGVMGGKRALSAIEWPTLILIAAMWPVGAALENSGTGELLAQWTGDTLGSFGPYAVLAAFATVAALLTQVLHNAVVVVSLMPVGLSIAQQMQLDVKTFAVTLIVTASISVMLPIGHPAPLLVEEPGGYRVGDYLRFGTPLIVLVIGAATAVVPLFFPFE